VNLLDRWLRPECHRTRQVLQSWLDGELGKDDAARVAAHLQLCERCGIEADLYRQVKDTLASLRVPPDPTVVARLDRFVQAIPGQVIPGDEGTPSEHGPKGSDGPLC